MTRPPERSIDLEPLLLYMKKPLRSMLDRIKQLFSRTQDPPYQSGANLLLVLVLSVVVGAGVSYGTLGFMKAFDSILNWAYFDWTETPTGRYTHKYDQRINSLWISAVPAAMAWPVCNKPSGTPMGPAAL